MEEINYHLVGNPEHGDSLEELRAMAWSDGVVMCTRHTWVWPIFRQLKDRGFRATFSYELEEGAVNIIHGQIARGLLAPADFKKHFIIGIRADYRPFPYGQFEIVQNETTAGGRRVYMPLYPQPGLIPRDERRAGVETVCFSGRAQNSFGLDQVGRELEKIGCRFVFKGEGEWQNMDDVDVLLGIRSFSKKPYHDKPATKLFNAWLAGIPFIGGYDSAFEQCGEPGVNYLRVSSRDELMSEMRRLKDDPALYASIVREGKTAGQRYAAERVTDRWVEFLEGPAAVEYRAWAAGAAGPGRRAAFGGALFGLYEKRIKANVSRVVALARGG